MSKYRIDAEVRVSGGPWTAYTTTVETAARTAPTAHKAAFDIKHHESRMHGVADSVDSSLSVDLGQPFFAARAPEKDWPARRFDGRLASRYPNKNAQGNYHRILRGLKLRAPGCQCGGPAHEVEAAHRRAQVGALRRRRV